MPLCFRSIVACPCIPCNLNLPLVDVVGYSMIYSSLLIIRLLFDWQTNIRMRKGAREAESSGLLNRRRVLPCRGFESLPFRHNRPSFAGPFYFPTVPTVHPQ